MNIRALKAEMVKVGMTQEKLAKELNMTPRTLSNRFKKGVFGTDEIEIMVRILQIKNPIPIFFNFE